MKIKLLAAAGVVAMIAAIFVATKDAKEEAIEEEESHEEEDEKFVDKLLHKVKRYYRTIILATVSIFCFSMALHVSVKNTAAAVMAYKILSETYENHKEAAKEVVGKSKSSYISNAAAKKEMDKTDIAKAKILKSSIDGDTLFYEPITKTFFKGNIKAINDAEFELKNKLTDGYTYYISFRQFLDRIGLKEVKFKNAELIGWNAFDGELAIGYEVQVIKEGEFKDEHCIVLTYRLAPEYDFMDF